jgi:inner membrane protein involved in colicin E2 resistance
MSDTRTPPKRRAGLKLLAGVALLALPGGGLVLALVAATMYLTRRIGRSAFGATLPPDMPETAEHCP